MKTCSNTSTYLEEDETWQQNTGSDAGLKRKHNLDRKRVTANVKDKASFAGVYNHQAKKPQEPATR